MNKKLLLAATTMTATIAPVAAVISCGSKEEDTHTDIGFVVTPDATIHDGFFAPMWKHISAAKATTGKTANYIDVNKKDKKHTVDAVESLIANGASVMFQPGFMNSETILDNAIKHPNTKFFGVAYTKFVASTKAFTDVDNATANMTKFDAAKNIGLIHFKTHQQGFVDGYLTAAKYFEDHIAAGADAAHAVKYSAVSAKAYQDITGLLDGFIAGVENYASVNHKHVELIAPLANGDFYTNITVEDSNFTTTMTNVQKHLSDEGVKILMLGDPNAIEPFHGHGFVLATDGADFHKTFNDIAVSTDKNWKNIFTNAIKTAYKTGKEFETEYHDQMHLASFDNNELIIEPSHSYPDAMLNPAKAAMTKWESDIKAALADNNIHSIYEDKDANGNETATGTSKGMEWASALIN